MAWRLFGAKPLYGPMLTKKQLTINYIFEILIEIRFIQENTFQNVVCKMSTILSRPQCVNSLIDWCYRVTSISRHTWHLHLANDDSSACRAGPGFVWLNKSMSYLLMPWLLVSPGRQWPWWLYKICRPSMGNDSTCAILVMQRVIYIYTYLKQLGT